MTTDSHDNRLSWQQIVQTKNCLYYCQSYLLLVVTPCVQRAWVCRILVVPILSYGSPALQGWERWIRPHVYWELRYSHKKRKILRWRFFSPSAGLDLVRADWLPLYLCTIRNGSRGFACAFAYNVFGLASSVSLTVGRLLLSMSSTIVPVSSV